MARTTRQDRMVLDALWSDPTESDEVLGVHVRNSVSEVLGIQDVVSQCQSGVSSWEEYMPFWTWQSEGGKRLEESTANLYLYDPVCTARFLLFFWTSCCFVWLLLVAIKGYSVMFVLNPWIWLDTRGTSFLQEFNKRNSLKLIIRAHECAGCSDVASILRMKSSHATWTFLPKVI